MFHNTENCHRNEPQVLFVARTSNAENKLQVMLKINNMSSKYGMPKLYTITENCGYTCIPK